MKKSGILFVLLLCFALIVSACSSNSDKETSADKVTGNNESNLLFVTGDTVSEPACFLQNRFAAGENIVFRANAIDAATNEQAKDAKLQVHLSTGDVLDMNYMQHPPGADNAPYFWTAAYPVTNETPTGILEYYVTAESGNKKGEFRPFNVSLSLLTIIDPSQASNDAEVPSTDTEVDLANVETNQTVDIIATNFALKSPSGENVFYVKAGEEVTVNLKTEEGHHGISVVGTDVNIQSEGTATFIPDKPGEYTVMCNIFCGDGHGLMTATIIAK